MDCFKGSAAGITGIISILWVIGTGLIWVIGDKLLSDVWVDEWRVEIRVLDLRFVLKFLLDKRILSETV